MCELSKIVLGLAGRLEEEVDALERRMLKLNLSVGSQTALQSKLGVSSVWQCLAHHEKAITQVEKEGDDSGMIKLKLQLEAVKANVEGLEKTLKTEITHHKTNQAMAMNVHLKIMTVHWN